MLRIVGVSTFLKRSQNWLNMGANGPTSAQCSPNTGNFRSPWAVCSPYGSTIHVQCNINQKRKNKTNSKICENYTAFGHLPNYAAAIPIPTPKQTLPVGAVVLAKRPE